MPSKSDIGTQDLEEGMRAASALSFVRIATTAITLLALFDPAGLEALARRLPSGQWSDWLIEGASGWHATMDRLGPARLFDAARSLANHLAP